MLTVITYDVNTETNAGKKRLRQVAKVCVNYGQRVQNSVFECLADAVTFEKIKHDLLTIIDAKTDSIRFYHLGTNYESKIEHFGCRDSYDPEGFICL